MISAELQKKIDRAIRLIKSSVGDDVVEVSYSGGKDSDVILQLTKESGVKYRAIYKNTTIDPPKTIQHCKENGVEVLNPSISFLELIKKKGMPTRRARFCCEKLKEYKVMDKAIQGIRRAESSARAKRYNEPTICRIYGNNKKNHVNVILPILDWTNQDVEEFIADRKIKCHPLYYDEQGNFHAERRLGCIGCPLSRRQGLDEFIKYPKMVVAVIKALRVYFETHPHVRSVEKFGTPEALFVQDVFFRSYEDWKIADEGMFGKTDWKKYLEDYFNIKL